MRTGAARPYLWALGLLWLLPAMATVVGYLLMDKDVQGSCQGIGFGCTLSDADLLLLVMGLFGLPVLCAAGLLACGVIAFLQHRQMTQA